MKTLNVEQLNNNSSAWGGDACLYRTACQLFVDTHGWGGQWVGGQTAKNVMVFVRVPDVEN